MSSLLVERAHVVTAGLAVAVVYLISPVAARAATCDIVPRSFDCMSGAEKTADGVKSDALKAVKVAAVAPAADVASDADPVSSEEAAAPARTGRKSAQGKRNAKSARSASARRGRNQQAAAAEASDNVTRKGWKTRNGGFQARGGVVTSCFPARLRGLLAQISSHYGRTPVITSGYRSRSHNRRIGGARESQHIHCMAADFFIPGVSPGALAAYVKALPGRGGVGTYCGNRTVHLDVAERREWHWGCRGGSRYAGGRRHHSRRMTSVQRRYAAARRRG